MQYIEADDLEPATNDTHPVKYHEAWQQLCSCDGILVPGGFGTRGIEGKILAAEWARTAKKPYLGAHFLLLFVYVIFAITVKQLIALASAAVCYYLKMLMWFSAIVDNCQA